MSNSSEQNGRQTTPHQQPPALNDPRIRNRPSSSTTTTAVNPKICRDYIWGICMKGAACRYKHELEYNSMRATLKFCHNFQNRGACDWPDCTYLHISRDEENLFVSTGQIPRLLAERYAAMSVYDYMAAPPPPPPPPPSPPATVPASAVRFDPSRPPPSLPSKRHSTDSIEAGTSIKLRKVDSPDILCENCMQQEIRINMYKQEMERIQQEEEKQRLILKKKVDGFQNGKLLLRSILSPKWYCIMDNYIEGNNQGNSLSQTSTSFASETSTVPRHFLVQLVEHVFNSKNSSNILGSTQTSRESSVLESLSGLSRLNSVTTSSPDTLQTLLEALRPSAPISEQQGGQQNTSERAAVTSNGLTRLTNRAVPPGPGQMAAPAPFVTSSASAGPMPPPARPYYALPYPPSAQPPASAPHCASQPQPQPYYAQQYAGVGGPAAQYAAAAPPYPSGSSVGAAPQYLPTGADYPYYPSTPSYQ